MQMYIPLTEAMRIALCELAASERRTPKMQAAHLLEQALLGAEPEAHVSPAESEADYAPAP
jgi:hypothetical protein